MKAPSYRHTIRFRGSSHPQGRYQLQISEITTDGQVFYRAQWDFPTLRTVLDFLKKNFPNSQALMTLENQGTAFDTILAAVGF
jgi:hypothetical protein